MYGVPIVVSTLCDKQFPCGVFFKAHNPINIKLTKTITSYWHYLACRIINTKYIRNAYKSEKQISVLVSKDVVACI